MVSETLGAQLPACSTIHAIQLGSAKSPSDLGSCSQEVRSDISSKASSYF